MSSSPADFRTETWTLYALGMFVISLRLAARVRKRGVTQLQLDDWLTINCILWYTLLIVSLNKVFFGGGSNFMTAEEQAALTPETTAQRVVGSKWVLVSEEAMVLTVWTCKLGMLFLYHRLTNSLREGISMLTGWFIRNRQGLKQAKMIKLVFLWVVAGFVGTQFALFFNCRPFAEYWAVPTENSACMMSIASVQLLLDFSISDILVLVIAIPILFKLQVPLLQRAVLLTIFGMGIFIIAAAILTKLYSLYTPLLTYAYLNWYCREASVAVYVTNLPAIWSLMLDVFPALRRWGHNTQTPSSNDRDTHSRKRPSRGKDYPFQQFGNLGSNGGTSGIMSAQSQEHIVENVKPKQGGLLINKDVTFTVRRESVSDDDDFATNPSSQDHPDTPNGTNGRYRSDCSAA
ncbi:MAG: hypothetical protein Q9163_005364 [Psora crenata]